MQIGSLFLLILGPLVLSGFSLKSSPLSCFVGYSSTFESITIGAQVPCDGQCASFSGIISGNNVSYYNCVPNSVCDSLNLKNNCQPVKNDEEIKACCCNNTDNCNIANTNIVAPPLYIDHGKSIECYTGAYVNNTSITPIILGNCQGECSSITFETTRNDNIHVFTYYGCFASIVCGAANSNDWRYSLQPGVIASCCNSDRCLDPTRKRN